MKKFLLALSILFIASCSNNNPGQNSETTGTSSSGDSTSIMQNPPMHEDSIRTPASGLEIGSGKDSANNSGSRSTDQNNGTTSSVPKQTQ